MATALRPIAHEDRLSLVEHLDELRTRIIICLVGFVIAFGFCFWQNDAILEILDRPLQKSAFTKGSDDPLERTAAFQQAQKRLYLQWEVLAREMARSDDLSPALRARWAEMSEQSRVTAAVAPEATGRRPVTLGVGEPFTVTFRVVGYAAMLLTLPLLLYQAYAFILPAFSPREREVALPLMAMVPFLFVGGVVFAYYFVLPNAINFLQNFNDDNYDILLQARDFYKFSIMVLMVMGILFQVPIGILAVTRVGHRHAGAAAQEPPLRDPRDRDRGHAAARPGPGDDADDDGPADRSLRGLYPLSCPARPSRRARRRPRRGGAGGHRRRRAPARPRSRRLNSCCSTSEAPAAARWSRPSISPSPCSWAAVSSCSASAETSPADSSTR